MGERNHCPKCGRKLEPSDVDGYKFVCYDCDENFYGFEAVAKGGVTRYSVQQGWIRYRQVGDHVEERMGDSPSSDEFDTFEEAKAAYDAIDLEADWRTEKMCSGSLWRFDHRDAYKLLESYEIDDEGYADNYKELLFEKYGEEGQ